MQIRTKTTRIPHPAVDHHPLLPGAAIGALSLLLAVGLEAMGTMSVLNHWIADRLSDGKPFPHNLPMWAIWIVACGVAFGIPSALLHITLKWQRWIVWITALALALGWAPVLTLAAYAPQIGPLLVVTFWSGICALVYAGRHEKAITPLPNNPTP